MDVHLFNGQHRADNNIDQLVEDIFKNVASKEYDFEFIKETADHEQIDLATVRNKKLQTILHIAAGYGRIRSVSHLIKQGANVNAQDDEGQAPLHYACNHAHNTIARILIEAGAEVDLVDLKGWTPLHFTIARKENALEISPLYWEVVELLLEFGANPFHPTKSGKNCFSRMKDSVQRLNVRIIYLINKLKTVDPQDKASRERIINKYLRVQDFFELIEKGDDNYELIEALVTNALVNSRLESCAKITPLHRAAGHGQLRTAQLIINIGADINASDEHGRIPLHNAARFGHVDMIELLINGGSDINRTDVEGYSPVHLAAKYRTITACMELMGLGADISIRSKTGERPCDLAESNDVKEVLKISSEPIEEIHHEDGRELHMNRSQTDLALTLEDYFTRSVKRTLEDLGLHKKQVNSASQYPVKRVILNENGWRYQYIRKRMFDTIELHSNELSGRFSGYDINSIELILNGKVWKKYKYMCKRLEIDYGSGSKNENLLFHGSNFIEKIVANGFDERYAKRKGMFGAGLYFAEHSSKSNQYTFGWNQGCPEHKDKCCFKCERKMIYAQVALGRCLKSKEELQDYIHAPPGYSSVAGEPGPNLRYPEYAIYNGDQAYPLFVIKYRLRP